MTIRFTPDADAELAEACQNLDAELMQSVDDALSRIASNPNAYPIVYRTLRRAVVRRFPFAIFYEITSEESMSSLFSIHAAIPRGGSRAWDNKTA